ncbi:hypothetical protein ACFLYA_00045 [Candidatus Dependentiae bacterium]
MKHLNAEKYNLAWFKLAECVSRKEKERALGVYRLLSHSLGNDALSTQLYGDLLLCFDDKRGAIEKYLHAAEIYKKSNKIIEAIAVHEHLIVLDPEEKSHMLELCDLYVAIDMSFKMIDHVKQLLKDNKFDLAITISQKLDGTLENVEYAHLNQDILFALLNNKSSSKELITKQLEKTVDLLQKTKNDLMLNDFLSTLKATSDQFHKHTSEYLQKS